MERHNEWVRENVPPERLHVSELKDGWAPLCKILDVPVPDEPYPRANDSAELMRMSKKMLRRGLATWFAIIAMTFASSFGLWRMWMNAGRTSWWMG